MKNHPENLKVIPNFFSFSSNNINNHLHFLKNSRLIIQAVETLIHAGVDEKTFVHELKKVCSLIAFTGEVSSPVCKGVLDGLVRNFFYYYYYYIIILFIRKNFIEKLFILWNPHQAPTAFPILQARKADPQLVCESFDFCEEQSRVRLNELENIDELLLKTFDNSPDSLLKPPVDISNIVDVNNNNFLYIMQVSDVHIDYQFVEGGNVACDTIPCCHEKAINNQPKAAHFGDYQCDLAPCKEGILVGGQGFFKKAIKSFFFLISSNVWCFPQTIEICTT